ncbi:MSCRAMM family protein [Bacillus suaedaesalsae]|uniref:Carboxypeptidase regulatory-like domain-containing protein n=1 Tax=Bacillus suaedaesalsae TaxID=2810349 RepID=A0ABS2DL46_9BACI|nr:carboxypeptidase-like regulatory domain-containing protein [Bacillus suaedaesalsae]MBM6619122.1 hypothetical protein [Bacillus suaedaesalsae]
MKKKFIYTLILLAFLFTSSVGNVNAQTPSKKSSQGKEEVMVREGIHPIKNSQLVIQSKEKTQKVRLVSTNAKGQLSSKIPDGDYSVKAVNKGNKWYSAKESFTVKQGKVKSSENQVIQLSNKKEAKAAGQKSDSNFQGKLTEGNKGLKGKVILSRYTSEYEEEVFTVSSKNNGEFTAVLPDGDYLLFGIELENGFYNHELYFSVLNGIVTIDGVEQKSLQISLPEKAYSGKVTDGTRSVSDAVISLEQVINEEEYHFEFVEYVLTNKKGEYSLRELSDGKYMVSVSHPTYYEWKKIIFEVKNGETYIDGKKVNFLNIQIPNVTLKGKLVEGKTPITNAWIGVEGYDEKGEHTGYFDMSVDKKGNFEYRLSDGQYFIREVYENNRQSIVNVAFEILNGKIVQDGITKDSITINLPPVTLQGQLVDQGVTLQGHINIEKYNEEEGYFDWYYASTDENGQYSLRLPDGSYKVTGAYLYDMNQEVGLSTQFQIENGKLYVDGELKNMLILQLPPVSLNGVVLDGENPVTGGTVTYSTADETSYYWSEISEDGKFLGRLVDGEYKIKSVYLYDNTQVELNQEFTIQNGSLYVYGEPHESLLIKLPAVTVIGTLLDNGNPVPGFLSVYSISDEYQTFYYGSANEEGKFQLRLPDGEYVFDNVYLYDDTSFRPNTRFTVLNGELFVNEEKLETLQVEVPALNLTGSVYDGHQLLTEGYVNVVGVGVEGSWYSSWINEEGTYKFRLSDGEYELQTIDSPAHGYVYFNKFFSVVDGRVVVDGTEVTSWDLFLGDATAN